MLPAVASVVTDALVLYARLAVGYVPSISPLALLSNTTLETVFFPRLPAGTRERASL